MKKKVSIIILNHNGLKFLKKCLASVKNQSHKNIEIIVSDNASIEGSQSYVSSLQQVKLISHQKNYGFCKANNIAATKASGEFLLFINNDVELFDKTVENLVNCHKKKSIVCG